MRAGRRGTGMNDKKTKEVDGRESVSMLPSVTVGVMIAAIAFAVLAGFMIYPLIRLGKMFDQISQTVRESGEHAIPALDEGVTTVKQVNKSLEDVNKISAAASTTANNVGALTDLYGSFLGKPIIKIASTFYALKTTGQSFLAKNAAKTTVNDTAEKGE